MNREYIYRAFERFWHWTQAILIILLGVTGFEIHGVLHFFGFRQAVALHNAAAISFLILIVFAIFWHFTTGEWRQYLPTREHLRAQINYYVFGIFRGAPHPTKKRVLSKLNPLQKLVYAGLKALVIPVMAVSGLLYMFYRYPQRYEVISLNVNGLEAIALVHTLGAFALVCFFIAHLYLITTGSTATSNLKAMITGFEDLPDTADLAASPKKTAEPAITH
jgi:thiosulfate reductase cytochrome b subunit